jgi:hypothetical protein
MNYGYAQKDIKEIHKGNESILYDNEDTPIARTECYYKTEGKRVPISSAIQYKLGKSKLQVYCDSIYYISRDKLQTHTSEIKYASVDYMIIFDSYLRIKDIRILKRENYDNSSFNYDALFKQILLSTQGKWKRTRPDEGVWYYYKGTFSFAKNNWHCP